MSNKFPVNTNVKFKSHTGDRGYMVSSVSYTAIEGGCVITAMNTPNEKFKVAIETLCAILGIDVVETKQYYHRRTWTTYYRPRGTNPSAPYYTAADFTVVLSSMVAARLADGEKLTK